MSATPSPREPFAPNSSVYDAEYYEKMYRPHWFLRNARKYRERDEALLRLVRPHPAMRVLELGSARGDTALFLAPRVARVVGVDAAPAAVEQAREAAFARGVANVRFELADARDLSPLGDASFEAVVMADFVEHVTDDVLVPALAESLRVLVPGGALAIYTPNRDHWAERLKAAVPGLQQPDHIAVRSSSRVVELAARGGFQLDELFFTSSPYPVIGAADRLLAALPLCRFRTCIRGTRPAPGGDEEET